MPFLPAWLVGTPERAQLTQRNSPWDVGAKWLQWHWGSTECSQWASLAVLESFVLSEVAETIRILSPSDCKQESSLRCRFIPLKENCLWHRRCDYWCSSTGCGVICSCSTLRDVGTNQKSRSQPGGIQGPFHRGRISDMLHIIYFTLKSITVARITAMK